MSRFFGAIRQNGYVVRDIDAAMAYWTEVLGVGPFYYIHDVPVENFAYRGTPSDAALSIALANTGDLQIELIQQRNDAPSMYKDFLDAGHEGLQNIAYWTKAFDDDLAKAKTRGFTIGQRGEIGERGGFVYFAEEHHPGTVIELSDISGPKGAFFDHIRNVAAKWDGKHSIRAVGE